MRVTSPRSTAGRRASCWVLLKRWISSMKRMVLRPVAPRASLAAAMALRTSATVPETAESVTNRDFVAVATIPAREVLPVPAGPHSTMEPRRSAVIRLRSGPLGPTRCAWPTSSSRERGRILAARGAKASKCSSAAWVKRLSAMSDPRYYRGVAIPLEVGQDFARPASNFPTTPAPAPLGALRRGLGERHGGPGVAPVVGHQQRTALRALAVLDHDALHGPGEAEVLPTLVRAAGGDRRPRSCPAEAPHQP